jgi:hypothetical protein
MQKSNALFMMPKIGNSRRIANRELETHHDRTRWFVGSPLLSVARGLHGRHPSSSPYAPGRDRAWIKSNDALKMPKVLLAIIAAGIVVLIAVLVVAVFSL